MKGAASAALLSLIAATAHAAPVAHTPGLAPPKCNAPINVSADKFLADLNGKTATYAGNVIVTQCDMRMRSNTLKVNVTGKNNAPDKIFADGNVVMDSAASGTATGDAAVYDVNPRLVTLTGHVVLKRAKDVMTGTLLTVNLVTGQATLGAKGAPGVTGQTGTPQGGRVQGVFTPQQPGAAQ
jgi:lipopolysaccharide export system protein LptA